MEEGKKTLMKARYEEILPYCDIVFGSPRDLLELLEIEKQPEEEIAYIQRFLVSYDLDLNKEGKPFICGRVITKEQFYETEEKLLTVLDRIGTGDAYAAGILLGYAEAWSLEKTATIAITNAVFAHTLSGDVPLTTRAQIQQMMYPTKAKSSDNVWWFFSSKTSIIKESR